MKSMRLVLAFGLLIVLTLPGTPGAADLGLITGSERGTYYQFGLNLQTLVKPHGIVSRSIRPAARSRTSTPSTRSPVSDGHRQADALAFVSRIRPIPS
jgi:hypothetical protein